MESCGRPIPGSDTSTVREFNVDAGDLGQHHVEILLLDGELPDRCGDLGRCENGSRHLIEQRLENVVVASVDQNDLGVAVPERVRRREPGKASTDDHHALSPPGATAAGTVASARGRTSSGGGREHPAHVSLICASSLDGREEPAMSSRRGRLFPVPLTRFSYLLAQFEQSEQDFVALRLEFSDRARTYFGVNAVDEHLLYLGGQHRRAENLPPRGHRTGELLEEMLDATLAAAEVVEKHIAHDAPTQARPPAQRCVDIGCVTIPSATR